MLILTMIACMLFLKLKISLNVKLKNTQNCSFCAVILFSVY